LGFMCWLRFKSQIVIDNAVAFPTAPALQGKQNVDILNISFI